MQHEDKAKLIRLLENGQIDLALSFVKDIKATRKPRTSAQNRSLHLWLNMIEREAENQGVTQNMLIKHTSQLRVTAEWMKSNIKQLIKALWNYDSTTELKKHGDIDIVIDHVTDWLSKEMEVPPFPCNEPANDLLNALELRKKLNYPEV